MYKFSFGLTFFLSFLFSHLSFGNSYSPSLENNYPVKVFWGDTHLHTNFSNDAYGRGGNKRLSPRDAYRIASGATVTAENGMQVRLNRPLDFLVIADHIESIGVRVSLQKEDPGLLQTTIGKHLHSKFRAINSKLNGFDLEREEAALSTKIFMDGLTRHEDDYLMSVWQRVAKTADEFNQPGLFTAFTGYEWTSLGTDYQWGLKGPQKYETVHRVVIFADNKEKTTSLRPLTAYDSGMPEDLWSYMETYEKTTGGHVLAIPHNGNMSNGAMFRTESSKSGLSNTEYARLRKRWEPLYEVTQIKGDSEAYPLLSPDDEFADYETWNGFTGRKYLVEWSDQERKIKEAEYARPALKKGLEQKNKLGVNPFKFGLVGSTDSHNSMAAVEENNYWGKFSRNAPHKNRILSSGLPEVNVLNWEGVSSGYAAIWAEENTRESLFAAMKRKEVYASTGPRMTVRFFGGWDYHKDDAFKPTLANIGYNKGVPMGGDLTAAPNNTSPKFLIRAVKDPDGANLDRVQVIKGWHDAKGQLHEKIYNVALSDGRKDQGVNTQKVGSTVDIPDASYTNTIGSPELAVVWEDPDFDKDELSFYYVRVLQIPTPRWTAYDAKFFQLKDIPEEVPMVTQERAYTSPIWYTPQS